MRYLAIIIACLCLFLLPLQLIKKNSTSPEHKPHSTTAACAISIQVEGRSKPLELEEYIVGVVSAEMPSSFHVEALKAQAIAARTFALKTTNYGATPIKPTVSHQAFIPKEKQVNNEMVKKAVKETSSQVLTYQNQLITAMFFSTSNGATESAENYSGFEIPYLTSTDSSGDSISPKFQQQQTFTLSEWNKAFGFVWSAEQLEAIVLQENESNRIQSMTTGQHKWTGREVRDILKLPSTDFDISIEEEVITVSTKGYGHGVGMSQYGANAMANEGKKAEDILRHYYQKTEIKNFQTLHSACLKKGTSDNTSK
ncbi:MAG: stage II sporulation protein D [Paenisporosarcina sp.]